MLILTGPVFFFPWRRAGGGRKSAFLALKSISTAQFLTTTPPCPALLPRPHPLLCPMNYTATHSISASTLSLLSETSAGSMAFRVALSAALYAVLILGALVPATRKRLQADEKRWSKMHARAGQALTSTAEETVLAFALSVHHLSGGFLMLAGQLTGFSELWVTGLCIEIGFEIVDIIALLRSSWPYTLVQPGLKFITVAHHLPGLVASPGMVLVGQLHLNNDLQQIGWALLLAGGVSLLCDAAKQSRDIETELGEWLVLHSINLCGVLFARFYIFPRASLSLIQHIGGNHPAWLYYVSLMGIASMSVFNVVILTIMTGKLFTYGRIYAKKQFTQHSKKD